MNLLRTGLSRPGYLAVILLSVIPIALVLVYHSTYRLAVPFGDEFKLNGHIAVLTADHRLTISDLFFLHGGHRVVPTNVVTALSTFLYRWDLRLESVVILILAFVCLTLLLSLFHRGQPALLMVIWLPFVMISFSLYRERSWWIVRNGSHFFFVNAFVLGALWVTVQRPLTRSRFGLATLLAICATFSSAHGMVVWPVIAFVWFAQQRQQWRWRWMVPWIVIGSIVVALYLQNSGILSEPTIDNHLNVSRVLTPSVERIVLYVTTLIGSSIVRYPASYVQAIVAGVMGGCLFLLNLMVLWRQRNLTAAIPWIAVAGYSLGSALMASLGRADSPDMNGPMKIQYIHIGELFWISLIALMAIVVAQLVIRPYQWRGSRILIILNLGVGVALLLIYVRSSVVSLQMEADFWDRPLTLQATHELRPDEQCVLDFPFTRNEHCLGRIILRSDDYRTINELAARHLNMFTNLPISNVLPTVEGTSSVAVISTDHAWWNVHIREYLLAGISESQLFHLAPDSHEVNELADLPTPLVNASYEGTEAEQEQFERWLLDKPSFWLIETTHTPDFSATFLELMTQHGFAPAFHQIVHDRLELRLTHYERDFHAPDALFTVGDSVDLTNWSLEQSVEVAPCQAVTLDTWWRTTTSVSTDFNVTAVLADANGIGVARNDGVPAGQLMTTWETDAIYLDHRTLTVPCDLAAGSYPMLVGIYDYRTGESLPAATADGSPVGGLIYLTTLHVR